MVNRVVALATLLVLGNFMSYSQNSNPAEDVSDTVLLKNVIIEENRLSYSFSEASKDIGIVEKTEINNLPAQSLPEILGRHASVDIRQRGPLGVQADIGIRGGTFEQTLILLNGIKMSDPQTGHHVMNVPIMFDNLERIEIIKGPAARIYGQNAYAGAVNFITKVPDNNSFYLRSYGGDFGSWGVNVGGSYKNQKIGHFASIGTDQSNGFRYNTDYKIYNGFYQGELKVNDYGKFDYLFGITQRKFGANGFYASPDYIEQYEEVRTAVASLSYEHEKDNVKITSRFSWRNNKDKYDFIRDNPGAYENLHFTNTYSLETNSSIKNRLGVTGFGVEFRRETINGDWLRGGNASKSNLDGFYRNNIGLFAEHHFSLAQNKFDITPGVYYGWYSDFGQQFFPGIDFGYNVSQNIRLYSNIGKSYRIPTFYDQYYISPVEEGNPDLEPENAWTYELGLRYLKDDWMFEGNVFYRDNQNLIDWVYDTQDSLWNSKNFAVVQTQGLELAVSYNKQIQIVENSFFIDMLSFSYNKLNQEMANTDELSRYVLEQLSDQFIVSSDISIYGKLKTSIVYRYLKRIDQDAYSLLDGRIFWKDKKFDVFMEATNITNTKYTEVMTPMPGRWFRMGFKINLVY